MLNLTLTKGDGSAPRIMCIGAHPDDIEIGCGGTILRLAREYPDLSLDWIVFGADQERRVKEAIGSAESFLAEVSSKRIVTKSFRDGFFPYTGGEIKDHFEQLKAEVNPDVIFTHCRHDAHQDHRLLCELTWNTFRNHLILEYEVIKYDGDLGAPNFFVYLDEGLCRRKTGLLMEHFATQRSRDWFAEETFLSMMRIRGIESRSSSGYAEAFYCRKVVL